MEPVIRFPKQAKEILLNYDRWMQSFRALDLEREMDPKDGYLSLEDMKRKGLFLYYWPYAMNKDTGMVHREDRATVYSTGTFGKTPWWLPDQKLENRYLYLRNGVEKWLNPAMGDKHNFQYGTVMEKNTPTWRAEELKTIAEGMGRSLSDLWANPLHHPSLLEEAELQAALRKTNIRRFPRRDTDYWLPPPPSPEIQSGLNNDNEGTLAAPPYGSFSSDQDENEPVTRVWQNWLETEGPRFKEFRASNLLEKGKKQPNNAPSSKMVEEQVNRQVHKPFVIERMGKPRDPSSLTRSTSQTPVTMEDLAKMDQTIRNLEYRMRNPLSSDTLRDSPVNPQNNLNKAGAGGTLGRPEGYPLTYPAPRPSLFIDPNNPMAGIRENEALLQKPNFQTGAPQQSRLGTRWEGNGINFVQQPSVYPDYTGKPQREAMGGERKDQAAQQQLSASPGDRGPRVNDGGYDWETILKKTKTERDNF
ncbi:hypothetical protein AA313_de0207765 [Arthrobotrys entomopaga]|nr:hypothetical protein AA313_de0207765 [Arthrobotrys entomopaga]